MTADEELTDAELEELERLAQEGGKRGKIGRAWLSIEESGGGGG